MRERCPCCNARLKQAATCPRCRADLTAVIHSEKSAALWLDQAMRHLSDNEIEKSSLAINRSLRLKETKLALAFRGFLIHQQCRAILDLLSETQVLSAKGRLYHVRLLMPYSRQLQHLNAFTDYLLVNL